MRAKTAMPIDSETTKMVLFLGCRARYLEPEVGKTVIRLLQRNGLTPVLVDQKCCATPKLACGDKKGFIRYGRFNVDHLDRSDTPIVTDCTTCALTLKREYPEALRDEGSQKEEDSQWEEASKWEEASQRVAGRTYDIMECLVALQKANRLDTTFNAANLNVYYHSPCHLRALGPQPVQDRIRLLRSIPGLTVTASDNGWCCGMGGTFGFKEKNFEMSMAIGRGLFEKIAQLSPDAVVTECAMCKTQIEQGTGLKVIHPAEIVYNAYGLA